MRHTYMRSIRLQRGILKCLARVWGGGSGVKVQRPDGFGGPPGLCAWERGMQRKRMSKWNQLSS